jgi:hypothetical protein
LPEKSTSGEETATRPAAHQAATGPETSRPAHHAAKTDPTPVRNAGQRNAHLPSPKIGMA